MKIARRQHRVPPRHWAVLLGLLLSVLVYTVGMGTPVARARAVPAAPSAVPPPPVTLPAAPRTTGTAAFLVDADSGAVLYSRNGGKRLAMASTTKIMTSVVALSLASPDQRITVGNDAAAMISGENSVAGLRAGDVLTLRELLYGLMLPSGDDAAVAIADGVAGSQQRFVALMNAEAALLGLSHTRFLNVHGLDENATTSNTTTVEDLARLARVGTALPLFREIAATAEYRLPATAEHREYTWVTTNELLTDRVYSGAIGIKTGYTGQAGYCLVFEAQRGDERLIGVIMGEADSGQRFTDASVLLDWGFARLRVLRDWQRAITGS